MKKSKLLLISAASGLLFFACSKSSNSPATTTNIAVPAVYNKIYGATSITNDGTFITIKSSGLPDHKSCYYATSNALYQAFSGKTFADSTFHQNPNTIGEQSYTFKIPVNPAVASTHASTPLGAIGVSINGVPFYNQYAANYSALSAEVPSLDQGYGHPDQGSRYHYHVEPIALTATKGEDALVGFLLDGFPVYGPMEDDTIPSNLDVLSWAFWQDGRLSKWHLSLSYFHCISIYKRQWILWHCRHCNAIRVQVCAVTIVLKRMKDDK